MVQNRRPSDRIGNRGCYDGRHGRGSNNNRYEHDRRSVHRWKYIHEDNSNHRHRFGLVGKESLRSNEKIQLLRYRKSRNEANWKYMVDTCKAYGYDDVTAEYMADIQNCFAFMDAND